MPCAMPHENIRMSRFNRIIIIKIPEIVMKRKVCESCGEGTFEFDLDTYGAHEYICGSCST